MKANKLTPRHAAPVQREINTTSSESGTGLTPRYFKSVAHPDAEYPFAGDDAE
jgi:prenylated cyclic peptide (anacyclamide/piricyclamide family)